MLLASNIDVLGDILQQIWTILHHKTSRVDIDIARLVYDMIHNFHDTAGSVAAQESWFAAGPNIPAACLEFLRTRDCFDDTAIAVHLEVLAVEHQSVALSGKVHWFPPRIRFHRLNHAGIAGQEYRITPAFEERFEERLCYGFFIEKENSYG
jgi:hypothetical protein